jgi:hypothetical protein
MGEAPGTDRLAPAGRGRERERERAGEKAVVDRQGQPVRRRGRAGARPSWAELGCFSFFLFLWIF